jgi:hypothetical protein
MDVKNLKMIATLSLTSDKMKIETESKRALIST